MYNFVINHREFISIVISFIALFLSLYNFIFSIYIRKKKITIRLICYEIVQAPRKLNYTFKVIIENNSQLPISIANISFNNIDCENREGYIFKITSNNKSQEFYSIKLPINLSSLMSISGFLRFATNEKLDFNNLTISLNTNRGYIKNCKLEYASAFKEVTDII